MIPVRSAHPTSPVRATPAVLAAVATLALGSACGEPPGQVPPPPPGAVIQVGAGYIFGDEIDRWVGTIALVEPTETRPSWRRKALTNIVLPLRIGSLLVPREREGARLAVERARAVLAAGGTLEADGPQVERLEGNCLEVGLTRWGVARTAPRGVWTEVFETVAGFTTLRVLEAPPAEEWNGGTQVVIEHVTGFYLRLDEDPRALLRDARRQMELRAVDPEWEWILPKVYEYER